MQHTTVYGFTCDDCECGCECKPSESIPFLDTLSTIKDGKIITDLYRKPTDRCQYLLTSSCHPPHVTNNIPYSLALRIVRICSLPEDREKRFSELKDMLIKRDYKSSIVDAAIDKARKVPRPEALKRVTRDRKQDRPVLVVTHDPRLPAVAQIVKKHWRAMTQNPHMKSVYPKPPMIAFKRPRNLKDVLVKAKVPPPPKQRPTRVKPGMHKCNSWKCSICPFVKPQKEIKATHSDCKVSINKHFNCNTENIVYIIECKKQGCKQQYIGQTMHSLRSRFLDHLGYVRREEISKSTGEHFRSKGHSMADMTISVLEQVKEKNTYYRECRESNWIQSFNLKFKGLNRKR